MRSYIVHFNNGPDFLGLDFVFEPFYNASLLSYFDDED